jgi:hypothetical protein
MISQWTSNADIRYTSPEVATPAMLGEESETMKSVQARRTEPKAVDAFEDLPAEERLERNRKLAALLREWENDPTGEGERFWPILKAELDRLD